MALRSAFTLWCWSQVDRTDPEDTLLPPCTWCGTTTARWCDECQGDLANIICTECEYDFGQCRPCDSRAAWTTARGYTDDHFDATLGYPGEGPMRAAALDKSESDSEAMPSLIYETDEEPDSSGEREPVARPKKKNLRGDRLCREASRAADWTEPKHLEHRGTGAWLTDPAEHPALRGDNGVNRLMAHAVTDKTAKSYATAVREFLSWAEENKADVASGRNLDASLADYVAWLCYGARQGMAKGRLAVFGVEAVLGDELDGRASQARRALQAWGRLAVEGEGGPIPWEGVGAIAAELEDLGYPEAAEIVTASADMYWRENDWSKIQKEDVSGSTADPLGMAVQLGVPERGESTKTGVRQGVRPDRSGVAAALEARAQRTEHGELIYTISPAEYRKQFNEACKALQYDAGPPHALRHTGPSFDLLHGYRSLDQVRTRGRWRAKTSVLRYAKTHVYISAAARMPHEVRAKGSKFLVKLGDRATGAPA